MWEQPTLQGFRGGEIHQVTGMILVHGTVVNINKVSHYNCVMTWLPWGSYNERSRESFGCVLADGKCVFLISGKCKFLPFSHPSQRINRDFEAP